MGRFIRRFAPTNKSPKLAALCKFDEIVQIRTYDQFEFESWESENFLAIASEGKNIRGGDSRVETIEDFFQVTETYECFSTSQNRDFDKAVYTNLSNESECVIKIEEITKELNGLEIASDQLVHIIESDWNLVDIVWDNGEKYYRAIWLTAA